MVRKEPSYWSPSSGHPFYHHLLHTVRWRCWLSNQSILSKYYEMHNKNIGIREKKHHLFDDSFKWFISVNSNSLLHRHMHVETWNDCVFNWIQTTKNPKWFSVIQLSCYRYCLCAEHFLSDKSVEISISLRIRSLLIACYIYFLRSLLSSSSLFPVYLGAVLSGPPFQVLHCQVQRIFALSSITLEVFFASVRNWHNQI